MLTYAAVLVSCLVLLAVAPLGSVRQRRLIVLLCVLALTVFAALRGYVGTDTYAYHSMFADYSGEPVGDVLVVVEPIFALLMKAVGLFSEDAFAFVISIAIVQGLLLARLATTSKRPLEFLAIYVTVFYLNFHFNILRAGTAMLLLILAMRVPKENEHQLKFYGYGIAAVLTHYSTLIGFLPLIVLRQRAATARPLAIGLLASVVGFLAYLATAPESWVARYAAYADILTPDVSNAVSLSFVLAIPLYLLLYVSVVDERNWIRFTLLFSIWFLARWLTSIFTLFGRIEIIINALLLFSIIELPVIGWRQSARRIALIGVTVMWLFGSLLGLYEEDAILAGMGVSEGLYAMSPFIPYKFLWDDR